MVQALKQRVTIGAGGRVQIDASDLPEGRTAEVIVLVEEAPVASKPEARPTRLSDFIGKAKGSFASAEEADAYIRELRDEWDHRA
jgi:hypothetical protein